MQPAALIGQRAWLKIDQRERRSDDGKGFSGFHRISQLRSQTVNWQNLLPLQSGPVKMQLKY